MEAVENSKSFFSRNFEEKKFEKSLKIQKKIENSIFFKNEAVFMFCLTYVFSRNNFLQFQFIKNIFPTFDQFSKSDWDSRDGDGDSQCDRHDEF